MHPGRFQSKTGFESVTAGCDHNDVNKAAIVKAKARPQHSRKRKSLFATYTQNKT